MDERDHAAMNNLPTVKKGQRDDGNGWATDLIPRQSVLELIGKHIKYYNDLATRPDKHDTEFRCMCVAKGIALNKLKTEFE